MKSLCQAAGMALLALLMSSCALLRRPVVPAVAAPLPEAELFSQWGVENALQNETLGQRELAAPSEAVFSAVVVGLAQRGFAVRNLDRQTGYIQAQGPSALAANVERHLAVEMARAVNLISADRWEARPGNAQLSVTVWLRPTTPLTTHVKMNVANVEIDGVAARKYYAIYPPRLAAEFASLWASVDKELALGVALAPTKGCTAAAVY